MSKYTREGDTGSDVITLQKAIGATADGIFGPETKRLLIAFQGANNLEPDGIAGPLTWAVINGDAPVKPVPTDRLVGLDIYQGDDVSSWDALGKNFQFIFLKASDGVRADKKFAEYYKAAKAVGLKVGAYHFMQWGVNSGATQAQFFKSVLDGVGYGASDLPPVMDWEAYPERDPHMTDLAVAKPFIETLASLSGRKPIIYTSSSWPVEYGSPAWMANYYLWIASYRSSPIVPAPWADWTFWQQSGSATLNGLGNEGDLDYFNGSMADLAKL